MIKVKAYANYGFAGCDMEFEEEFPDDVTDQEIEETMKDLVYQQVDWRYEKANIQETEDEMINCNSRFAYGEKCVADMDSRETMGLSVVMQRKSVILTRKRLLPDAHLQSVGTTEVQEDNEDEKFWIYKQKESGKGDC